MPIDITMPALSPTMETGTLSKWLVKVGDTAKSGDAPVLRVTNEDVPLPYAANLEKLALIKVEDCGRGGEEGLLPVRFNGTGLAGGPSFTDNLDCAWPEVWRRSLTVKCSYAICIGGNGFHQRPAA